MTEDNGVSDYKHARIKNLLEQLDYAKQINNPVMVASVKADLVKLGYEFEEEH